MKVLRRVVSFTFRALLPPRKEPPTPIERRSVYMPQSQSRRFECGGKESLCWTSNHSYWVVPPLAKLLLSAILVTGP